MKRVSKTVLFSSGGFGAPHGSHRAYAIRAASRHRSHHKTDHRFSVVITGIGCIAAAGKSPSELWANTLAGKSNFVWTNYHEWPGHDPAKKMVAGIVKEEHGFRLQDHLPPLRPGQHMTKAEKLLYYATKQAVQDSGYAFQLQEEPEALKSGCFIATNFANNLFVVQKAHNVVPTDHDERDHFAHIVPNLLPERLIMDFHLHGPNAVLAHACAGGATAVLTAMEQIAHGHCDRAIAGAVETFQDSKLCNDLLARAGAYANPEPTRDPNRVMNVFGTGRCGTVSGDASAVVVLEEKRRAIARGARIYAEVLGGSFITSGHWVQLDKDHIARLVALTLHDAGIRKEMIDAVCPHATSTVKGDNVELEGLNAVFGDHAPNVSVTACKDVIGHPWAASSALETVLSCMMIKHNTLPHVANLDPAHLDPAVGKLDIVHTQPRQKKIRHLLKLAYGLGGASAGLLLGSPVH